MGILDKEEAPKGPDFNKLIKKAEGFVKDNNRLFREAMAFGKGQFSKAEEWSTKLEQFGMDAMGNLGNEANNFKEATAARISDLDKAGAEWGKQATDIYGQNKQLADKVTGKLLPGMGQSAQVGTDLLTSYSEKGIPFQDEYIGKLAGWDSTARREDRAAQAVSDIRMAMDATREAELRKLESFGIDPSQTRSAALDSRLGVQSALAMAQYANLGRQAVETEGLTHGKTASDMYNERLAAGLGSVESAGQQGRTIAEIARQPGADYLTQLAAINQYGTNVGALEQSGGQIGYNMESDAARFGERGKIAGATQQNAANNYGSSIYDQVARGIRQSADITQGAYQTGGQLNANDIARVQQNNENSLGGQIGELAGIALPFAMSAIPGVGPIAAAATTAAIPKRAREGREITREDSPSLGVIPDDVPVRATPGEVIIDPETVAWFGKKHFRNLKDQARKGMGIPETAGA